jgi:hypothetical protein
MRIREAAAGILLLTLSASAAAQEARMVSIATPRGVTQQFILIRPARPTAALILFAGGHGALGLSGTGAMRWGAGNFLVRSRGLLAARGFTVAVADAPSDRGDGMTARFRMSTAHAADIGAIASHLKGQEPLPVWLVGTSMGTFSAAGGAIAARPVDGLVLTSTITRAKPDWIIADTHPDGVASMALEEVSAPTLILAHRHDRCDVTPAADTTKLRRRLRSAHPVAVRLLEGGDTPRSSACEALSEHGFLGIEDTAVGAIAEFIRAQ